MSASAAALPAPGRRFDRHVFLHWFGLACLMGAAFFAGYVAWALWGTGLETQRAQNTLRGQIEREFGHPKPLSEAPKPGTRQLPGSAYAAIVIPSIGLDMIVVEGTGYQDLKEGPGHYPDTADPWEETGRVAIAGHRTTYLAPFNDLGELLSGDTIELLTPYGTFAYEVTRNYVIPAEGSGVVLEQTTKPTLVLTTCNPKFASYQRLIVEAELVDAPTG